MPDRKKEFIKAAKSGDIGKVKHLLVADAELIHARDKDGSTALHCAVWKGQQAIVELLLKAGADGNAHNTNGHWGTTPLHAAAHANQAAIAQLLIEHGADINARDMNDKTPMDHTAFHNARAVAKILLSHGAE